MRFRVGTSVALFAVLTLATFTGVSAQSATGNVVGHVTFCKVAPGPITAPEDDGSSPDLADVTPGLRRGLTPRIPVPVANLQLSVAGTDVTTQTDAAGSFTLAGVPAAQTLTVVAQTSSGPELVVSGPPLSVDPGQTIDLGNLSLPGCATGPFVLAPRPEPDTTAPPPDSD